MSFLKCKLRPSGNSKKKLFKIVVSSLKTKRNGKIKDKIGYYNVGSVKIKNFVINRKKLNFYLLKGTLFNFSVKKYLLKFI